MEFGCAQGAKSPRHRRDYSIPHPLDLIQLTGRLQTMSSYPLDGDYDKRLLDSAPKASGKQVRPLSLPLRPLAPAHNASSIDFLLRLQERYDVSLLAEDSSRMLMPTRARAAVGDRHGESHDSSYSVPWYRQKKWRTIMLVVTIIVIVAAVGGAVGGTLASKNASSPESGQGIVRTVTLPTSSIFTGVQGGSTTTTSSNPRAPSTISEGSSTISDGPSTVSKGTSTQPPPSETPSAPGIVRRW